MTAVMPAFLAICIGLQVIGWFVSDAGAVLSASHITRPDALAPSTRFDAPSMVIDIALVMGAMTLVMALAAGFLYGEDTVLVGLSAGLWVGLAVVSFLAPALNSATARGIVTGVCLLCGYVGGNLSFWTLSVMRRHDNRREIGTAEE